LILKAVDLVYFLGPTDFAKYLESINYVSTVWDLCHRDEPEFPEVRWFNEFERRERSNFRILPKATAIITDSCVNKKNIISRYRIDEEKIFIIPFEPNLAIKGNVADREEKEFNVKQTYNLDCPYIFYPAQFWAHKNHIYILEGLKELENIYRLRVGAVFVGGDKGNMEYIRGQAVEMNLVDRVRILGFMPTADLLSFYQQAICLVMPTYFGPTNLPPLEAFVLGVPLLYSDLPGMREQVGDAALFINLQSPRSMADNLALIIQDLSVRNRLIQNGRTLIERLNAFPRAETLQIVFKNFQRKRTTWK
jgi:glycosyltransferase involved in cell wall biosynthesis